MSAHIFLYPGWDSNPHFHVSETRASFRLGYLGSLVVGCQLLVVSALYEPITGNQQLTSQSRRDSNPNLRIRSPVFLPFKLRDCLSPHFLTLSHFLLVQEARFERAFTRLQTACLFQLERLLLFFRSESVRCEEISHCSLLTSHTLAPLIRERSRHRTCTTRVKSPVLCRLSYALKKRRKRIRARKNPELHGLVLVLPGGHGGNRTRYRSDLLSECSNRSIPVSHYRLLVRLLAGR